jgi:hypothetical protein
MLIKREYLLGQDPIRVQTADARVDGHDDQAETSPHNAQMTLITSFNNTLTH